METQGLKERLDAKLGELAGKGFQILWIDASPDEIRQLFCEGGDSVILLDADPKQDRAWYGAVELRPSPHEGVRVTLQGEYEEPSVHYV